MISSQVFRNAYINLYTSLRNYLWDFDTVQLIADTEIAIYKVFPVVEEIDSLVARLRIAIRDTILEDEELKLALEELEQALSDNREVVAFIKQPKEVKPI